MSGFTHFDQKGNAVMVDVQALWGRKKIQS